MLRNFQIGKLFEITIPIVSITRNIQQTREVIFLKDILADTYIIMDIYYIFFLSSHWMISLFMNNASSRRSLKTHS